MNTKLKTEWATILVWNDHEIRVETVPATEAGKAQEMICRDMHEKWDDPRWQILDGERNVLCFGRETPLGYRSLTNEY